MIFFTYKLYSNYKGSQITGLIKNQSLSVHAEIFISKEVMTNQGWCVAQWVRTLGL